jgi:hypothetical protein
MSIFAKKPEWEQRIMPEAAGAPPPPSLVKTGPRFGISDAIALLRGLPADEKGDLVVRVVRATLASFDVHLPAIIEDATRRQKAASERIAAIHGQMAELDRQLENHRREISALEADLKETTSVRERLQQADKTAALAAGPPRTPTIGAGGKTPTPEPITKVTHETFKD